MTLARQFSRHPRRVVADAIAGPMTDSLRRELTEIGARLAEYEGRDVTAQPGCVIERMVLGDADVLVEFECEPASGDGWNEPRYEASVEAIQVYINGAWCDIADVGCEDAADRWVIEAKERWADAADAARIDAMEAA